MKIACQVCGKIVEARVIAGNYCPMYHVIVPKKRRIGKNPRCEGTSKMGKVVNVTL